MEQVVPSETQISLIHSKSKRKKRKKSSNKHKKKPLAILPPPLKSRKRARQITTQFHHLTREIDDIEKSSMAVSEKKAKVLAIKKQLDNMGGRQAYQSASQLSTSFFNTSKWVIGQLIQMGCKPKRPKEYRWKVLEVGAINTTLLSCDWMDVDAIDLKSTHPDIKEMDFFDLKPEGKYDTVVSSMVINCVPGALRRGEMLRRYLMHLKPTGYLFLTLPRLCLNNSKFITYSLFKELLEVLGFEIVSTKESPKVAFFCCKVSSRVPEPSVGNSAVFVLQQPQHRSFLEPPPRINKSKKFKNTFAVCLDVHE
mmetsp:Transcript_36090/g.46348  ORF Transcript_36090/g.46348 Transcript_36090/m.46348 type:complete len:310 (+) Transcript_36090:65-994(+)